MRQHRRLIVAIAAVPLFFCKLALASQDVELDKIVVTSSMTPETYGHTTREVDVITSDQIELSDAVTPADVLGDNSSVDIKSYGSMGTTRNIQMRGSTASQVLIMMDGRPLNNAHQGATDLSTIAMDNIERIEFMRGAASGLYGSDAMGGVVNIITKGPPKEGFKTDFKTSFGTFRTYVEQLTHGAKLKNFGYLVTGDYQRSDGSRDHSEYSAKNASLKLTYDFKNDNKIVFNTGFHKSNLETPGAITWTDYDDYQQQRKQFFDLTYNSRLVDKLGIFFRAYQNYDRLEFIEVPVPLDKSTHTTKKRGWELQADYQLFNFYKLVSGFNYAGNFDDSTNSAKNNYILRAGYLQNQLDLIEKVRIDFGARVDGYSSFQTEASPNFSILYEPDGLTKLRFFYGHSYRVPTFSDLYWPHIVYSAFYEEEGNPNLNPERGKSYEFGAERRVFDNLRLKLGYFRNDYKNLIKWDTDSAGVLWQPQNISSVTIQGVEFGSNFTINDSLDFDLTYTYQRPMNNKLHKLLTYQPQYKLNSALKFHNYRGLNLRLKWAFVNRSFTNEANTAYLKRYFILGLELSKKLNKYATFFTNIENMSATKFQVENGYPMPGFSVDGGFKLEF